jgi:hypothetical protein
LLRNRGTLTSTKTGFGGLPIYTALAWLRSE